MAEERNAKANFSRVRGLYEHRNASKSDLDIARAQSESAAAQVVSAKQRRQAARLQLGYTRLKSPAHCSIASTYVKRNENITAGQPLVKLNCGEQLEVEVAVPEGFIGRVKVGNQARIRFAAISDTEFHGTVWEVGVASNEGSTTFPVTLRLNDANADVRSGMAVDVIFKINHASEHIVVPSVAVREEAGLRFVFMLKAGPEQGRYVAQRHPITVGEMVPGGIVIASGLEDGDLIATAGVRRLNDGQIVTLLRN